MKISFHGAARTVTGSKHLVTLDNGETFLLDCGLFQGKGSNEGDKNRIFNFNPASIDYIILSHAHIDHSGNIPNLVKQGFKGAIICTPATADLCEIMLSDSAHIQINDLKFINKRRIKIILINCHIYYSGKESGLFLNVFSYSKNELKSDSSLSVANCLL